MEKVVSDLIEESCLAYEKTDTKLVRIISCIRWIFFLQIILGIGKSRRSHAK